MTAPHLLPTACHVCGHGEHATAPGGHTYWSNADADAEFAALDARTTVPALRLEGPAFPDAGYGS